MPQGLMEQGWLTKARKCMSPHFNARPNGEVSLLVIHNISLPAGCFGLPHIDELFQGCLNIDADDSFTELASLQVSAHFLICRDGEVVQYVGCDDRAWHAGISEFNGREGCNDFAIGIELEGTDNSGYTDEQYDQLILLTLELMAQYPMINVNNIVGHCDIAPGRKTDPGSGFDWSRYKQAIPVV
ncbi:1,6-anhydro-N-acetylmuramyl-L-alanine amidase AmpD [Shewanella sp. H8]|uniref:1,6-anhydro-N-acetylmuramyl-L-alanine amidase AmpD n=1 Tax=Shewanella sp. H8 TaxID=3342676 RepID=UPI0033155928